MKKKSAAQIKAIKAKLPAGNPQVLAKSLNPRATSAYQPSAKGAPTIKGLPSFMHGKNAGRSMILRG